MMLETTTTSGRRIQYHQALLGQGGMKDVHLSAAGDEVVAFYRQAPDSAARERLQRITGVYRERIFQQAGGDYWLNTFCWPTDMIDDGQRLGLVCPLYPSHFFFEHGAINQDCLGIKGQEKIGIWFASAKNRRLLDPREKGDWRMHLRLCILLSRAMRRLHAAGLAHSDLSFNNVLVDPVTGQIAVIDIDGLVVPGLFPPDVLGTGGFIAPEVMATRGLERTDPKRCWPCRETDQHALAVLIYMYLLMRHPLQGGKIHDGDPQRDEELSMGSQALFIEHAQDASNRPRLDQVPDYQKRWMDVKALPYTLTGPYLAPLLQQAFTEGLHDPARRPSAGEWEQALVKTNDLVIPCLNPACEQKWFPYDNSTRPTCPFCQTGYTRPLPILNLYSQRKTGSFSSDQHRVMVYDGIRLYPWHVFSNVHPNERLELAQKQAQALLQWHQDQWWLVNERLQGLRELSGAVLTPGQALALRNGQQILLSSEPQARLITVQMVN